jgi:hypothetical protein
MVGKRPRPEDLPLVDDGESVIRLVDPVHYIDERLETAHLPMRQPSPDDYGPSVFVASKLPRDVADLEAANVEWKKYGVARVLVGDLRRCGIEVRWTCEDCKLDEPLPSAHATIFGVTTRQIRDDVVGLIEKNLERKPDLKIAAPVVFICKLCGEAHPSTSTDQLTGVAQLPATITTRRDVESREWLFVCTKPCAPSTSRRLVDA